MSSQAKPVSDAAVQPPTMDPLQAVGLDVFGDIVSSLDAATLARCSAVSRSWRTTCSNPDIWRGHCNELWSDKVYVPEDLRLSADPQKAYSQSLADCKRTTITATELCTFAWTFKFKHQALDQAVHGSCTEMIRHFQHDGSYITGDNDAAFKHPRYRWHFSTNNDGCPGLFIQVNRFPRLSISRTPNWGWRLENPWVLFISLPPASASPRATNSPRASAPSAKGETAGLPLLQPLAFPAGPQLAAAGATPAEPLAAPAGARTAEPRAAAAGAMPAEPLASVAGAVLCAPLATA